MNPKHPVYVPSRGRWESRKTVKCLEFLKVPHRVVVEEQEFDDYASVMDEKKLLVLPESNQGLHYARNWIWEHALSEGAEWFWQLDDNITEFRRFNWNLRAPVTSGTIFRLAEDFVERFDNVAQAGFQYLTFVTRKDPRSYPPFSLNTRIYSCTLNRADLPFRYRSFYNDDTDLSLQCLKAGWCTVMFNAFLANKRNTMSFKGGLTDFYTEEKDGLKNAGRLEMARALVELHPDVTRVVWKWGRWQHEVDYRPFKSNRLQLKEGFEIPQGIDNHGMQLQRLVDGEWKVVTESPLTERGQ